MKQTLNKIILKIEHSVGPKAKVAIALGLLGSLAGLGLEALVPEPSDITGSTVMIVRPDKRGGGSGVVISSSPTSSQVLTNSHVCKVAENGGLVKTTSGAEHTVTSFKRSTMHDLCLIEVSADLGKKINIAKNAPKMYEPATVSGHPALLPNTVTQGHFSGNKVIEVMTGFKECTGKETNPEEQFLCAFLGRLPLIKRYEAVLVTATIMPGSSGSAVYTSKKELGALVFAGSGSIGYAFTVPHEHIVNFLTKEAPTLKPEFPNNDVNIFMANGEGSLHDTSLLKIKEACSNITRTKIKNICNIVNRDLIWRDM